MPQFKNNTSHAITPQTPFGTLQLPENWRVVYVSQIDSTMLQLKRAEYAVADETCVLMVTDFQTAGRGQRGTSWEADAGCNLLFGFTFVPHCIKATQQFALSEALALAVCEALSEYAEGFTVKWPNDVYWHDQKICGMLLEHSICGAYICNTLTGVGVNVNQPAFKSDAPNPISLQQIIGHDVDRTLLLQNIVKIFDGHYQQLRKGDFQALHTTYMSRLYRKTGVHTYEDANGRFRASIVDISPLGMLTLRKTVGSEHVYAFKEVKFIL